MSAIGLEKVGSTYNERKKWACVYFQDFEDVANE